MERLDNIALIHCIRARGYLFCKAFARLLSTKCYASLSHPLVSPSYAPDNAPLILQLAQPLIQVIPVVKMRLWARQCQRADYAAPRSMRQPHLPTPSAWTGKCGSLQLVLQLCWPWEAACLMMPWPQPAFALVHTPHGARFRIRCQTLSLCAPRACYASPAFACDTSQTFACYPSQTLACYPFQTCASGGRARRAARPS